jgi:hypothetical protein
MVMHPKSKPPVFVPEEHRTEVEALSKAALMDMVWDYAIQMAGADDLAIDEFRTRRDVILTHRKQAS